MKIYRQDVYRIKCTYRQNLDKDNPTRMEAEDFFEKLQYKMDSTGGALLNILSSLDKGEVVNLNQYSDI